MRRRTFITLLGGTTAWPLTARAQRPANKISIGFLSVNTPAAMKARTEAFQRGLRELGYVDGQNILIEYRFAEGNPDRLGAGADGGVAQLARTARGHDRPDGVAVKPVDARELLHVPAALLNQTRDLAREFAVIRLLGHTDDPTRRRVS